MDIQSATYTENGSILALTASGSVSVPDDMTNRLRRGLAEWEAAGNVIAAYDPPTQQEIDAAQQAELDSLVTEMQRNRSLAKGLAVTLFKLLKGRYTQAQINNATPATFLTEIRNNAAVDLSQL